MSSWARPGVKCVCIRVPMAWSNGLCGEVLPVLRQRLTVRTIEVVNGQVALTFVEIRNKPRRYVEGYSECVFSADNFRPLASRADDVALFAHHFERAGEPV